MATLHPLQNLSLDPGQPYSHRRDQGRA